MSSDPIHAGLFNYTLRRNNVRFNYQGRFLNLQKHPSKNPAPLLQAADLRRRIKRHLHSPVGSVS